MANSCQLESVKNVYLLIQGETSGLFCVSLFTTKLTLKMDRQDIREYYRFTKKD